MHTPSDENVSMWNLNYPEASAREYKAAFKRDISYFEAQLKGLIYDKIDNARTGYIPVLEVDDLNNAYKYARKSLIEAGINIDFDIKLDLRLRNVPCEEGSKGCRVYEHSVREGENTKIYYEFSGQINRA